MVYFCDQITKIFNQTSQLVTLLSHDINKCLHYIQILLIYLRFVSLNIYTLINMVEIVHHLYIIKLSEILNLYILF